MKLKKIISNDKKKSKRVVLGGLDSLKLFIYLFFFQIGHTTNHQPNFLNK